MANKLGPVSELSGQKAREETQNAYSWEQYLDKVSGPHKLERCWDYLDRICQMVNKWQGRLTF